MTCRDLLSSFSFPEQLLNDCSTPSPLASLLVSGGMAVVVFGLAYAVLQRLGSGALSDEGGFKRFVDGVRELDRRLVRYGSRIIGTDYYSEAHRKRAVLQFFGLMALFGVFLPWPWCLWGLSIGLFGVFIVYRHWSHNEGDEMYQEPEDKDIRIAGNLNFPMVVACACVFIYAPIAFAQMHLAHQGFPTGEDASPFTFVLYMLVEIVKNLTIVRYDDIFGLKLNFGPLAPVSITATLAVLVFRASFDLIVLAALKRFVDTFQRIAAGLDLHPYLEGLTSKDEGSRTRIVKAPQRFAGAGRIKAKDLLEDLLVPGQERSFLPPELDFSANLKAMAAIGITLYGQRRDDKSALKFASERLDAIARSELTRDVDELIWADIQEKLGDAYRAWGMMETYKERMRKAVTAYNAAFSVYSNRDMTVECARIERNIEQARQTLKERGGP